MLLAYEYLLQMLKLILCCLLSIILVVLVNVMLVNAALAKVIRKSGKKSLIEPNSAENSLLERFEPKMSEYFFR